MQSPRLNVYKLGANFLSESSLTTTWPHSQRWCGHAPAVDMATLPDVVMPSERLGSAITAAIAHPGAQELGARPTSACPESRACDCSDNHMPLSREGVCWHDSCLSWGQDAWLHGLALGRGTGATDWHGCWVSRGLAGTWVLCPPWKKTWVLKNPTPPSWCPWLQI